MIPEMTQAVFLTELRDTPLEAVRHVFARFPDATGLVLFRNQNFDSSSFGDQAMVAVGPSNTFKSLLDCEGKWLKDLPSQRQHPIGWISREAFLA